MGLGLGQQLTGNGLLLGDQQQYNGNELGLGLSRNGLEQQRLTGQSRRLAHGFLMPTALELRGWLKTEGESINTPTTDSSQLKPPTANSS